MPLRVKHDSSIPLDDWLPGLKASDASAYEAIFERMHGPLYRYVARIVRDEALAYDVLQDVFLKLWSNRATLRIEVSLSAFLYTMARNRALNALRRRKREVVSDEPNLFALHKAEGSVEASFEAEELAAHLARWMQELPPKRGEVFALSRLHGLSNLEISQIMGLSKRTVDTHIVHALRQLRTRYHALHTKRS